MNDLYVQEREFSGHKLSKLVPTRKSFPVTTVSTEHRCVRPRSIVQKKSHGKIESSEEAQTHPLNNPLLFVSLRCPVQKVKHASQTV